MINQKGFTLIELMLALALGLVISAAAIFLFLTAQKSYSMQQGLANTQENANFGLNYLTKDIRLSNLNNEIAEINDQTSYSGIVLTSSVNASKDSTNIPQSNLFRTIVGATANINLLSRSSGFSAGTAPAWTGASNVQLNGQNLLSDQLVIQYIPQYQLDDQGTSDESDDLFKGGFDCEGNELTFPVNNPKNGKPYGKQVVVQRYFLRVDSNIDIAEPNLPLALACDAGTYSIEPQPGAIRDYGDQGEIVMKRVDHFRVLLTVQNQNATFRYTSISDYFALPVPRPKIVALELGILSRSSSSVGSEVTIKDDQEFKVIDQVVTVKKDTNTNKKYVRQVATQTVAIRNALGGRGK